jgi:UDP-N-acetylglucosamine:LPS N-acetylglucosamine transferase
VNDFVKRIHLVYFDAGGGHRAAATALKSVIEKQGRPWEVCLVHLQELLQAMDVFRKITGLPTEDIYNQMLARGWTLGSAQILRIMQATIRLYHPTALKTLIGFWGQNPCDLVVSLVPNFNRVLCESVRTALGNTPFVTILTDLADYPPHFWIERQDQFVICGTEKAVEQAKSMGHPDAHIFRTSGMILRPKFYEPVTVDRAAELTRLGLDPAKPTGLVLFGGQGSKAMLEIAERLNDRQLILICGRNEKLAEKLRARGGPHFVEGFTSEIPYYMHLSDYLIGKPGPGSISEAVAMGLPVIVECNTWTLPQERYNTEWVREKGLGIVLKNFSGIREAADQLLTSLPKYKANAAAIENRAIFEIPDILATLMSN